MAELNLLEVDVEVVYDPDLLPNTRGDNVGETTDIQESYKVIKAETGVNSFELFPIQAIPHPTEPGVYLVWDGNRRVAAARKLGIKYLPAYVFNLSPQEALDAQLTGNVRREQPLFILDKDSNIIRGLAWQAKRLSDRKMSKGKIAKLMGMGNKQDNVSAMIALYRAPVEVLHRISAGDLALTVWSRMKRQPKKTILAILEKNGQISRSYVDKKLVEIANAANAPASAAETAVDETEEATEGVAETAVTKSPSGSSKPTVSGTAISETFTGNVEGNLAELLTKLKATLAGFRGAPGEMQYVQQIRSLCDETLEGGW